MNAPAPRRLPVLVRLHALRERRAQAAEIRLAEAQAEVDRARVGVERALLRRSEVDDARAALDVWFETGLDPRHIDAALARRGALVAQRHEAQVLVDRAEADFAATQTARAEAAAALARARARLDLVASQLTEGRRADARRREARAEAEQEERRLGASALQGAWT